MSHEEVFSICRQSLGIYADWTFVQNSYLANAGRTAFCLRLVSENFERSVVILNGRVMISLETSEAYRRLRRGESSANCASRDEAIDVLFAEQNGGSILVEEDAVQWNEEVEDTEARLQDERSGFDPLNALFFLSPDGEHLTFQFYSAGELYIFIDGLCTALAYPLCDVQYAPSGTRRVIMLCNSISHQMYLLDANLHDCQLLSSAFSQDGKYFFSVQYGNIQEFGEDLTDVAVNGDIVFSTSKIQYWNPVGAPDDEVTPRKCFVLDPFGRAALFGFWEPEKGRPFEALQPVIGVLSLQTGLLTRYPGFEILDAMISSCGDGFEVTALKQNNGGIPLRFEIRV
jgi:hypothetical protein